MDELIIFKESDMDSAASLGVAHRAVYNIKVPLGESPCEGFEAMALI
jgi:hypothetical protein